jgi:hypothetical protein
MPSDAASPSKKTLQTIADALINHPDPDVVAFQERHNRQQRRHLNQLELDPPRTSLRNCSNNPRNGNA